MSAYIPPSPAVARRARRATGADVRQPTATSASGTTSTVLAPLEYQAINISTPGTYDLVAGLPGKSIQVFALEVFSEVPQDLDLLDGTISFIGGGYIGYPGNTPWLRTNVGEPHWRCSVGNALRLTVSQPGQTSGYVQYRRV